MKDIFSKITFGFFMAQFVPGVITVLAISLVIIEPEGNKDITVYELIKESIDFWFKDTTRGVGFIALSIGSGMAIHGLHWGVLGFLETFRKGEAEPICDLYWHKWPIIIQILLGPIIILVEFIAFIIFGRSILSVAIKENVQSIDHNKMTAFQFLQDFYLNFAQFYAHTSYALLITNVVFYVVYIKNSTVQKNYLFNVWLYLLCGIFFVISRIQFTALFQAENDLTSDLPEEAKSIQESDSVEQDTP